MTMIELVAAVLGLACVWLSAKEHIACWPTGLAMVVLYAFVFYQARLYSDTLLQLIYIVMQLYGWWAWMYGGPQRRQLQITRLKSLRVVGWLITLVAGFLALGWTMDSNTDASFPYVDAFATVASLVAQWWMGRKILESWLMWIVVDCVSIGLYAAKQLYPTAVLYSIFLLLAIWGWKEWRETWKKQATG